MQFFTTTLWDDLSGSAGVAGISKVILAITKVGHVTVAVWFGRYICDDVYWKKMCCITKEWNLIKDDFLYARIWQSKPNVSRSSVNQHFLPRLTSHRICIWKNWIRISTLPASLFWCTLDSKQMNRWSKKWMDGHGSLIAIVEVE